MGNNDDSRRKCLICDEMFSYGANSLTSHIKKEHNLTRQEYYDLFLSNEGDGICPHCGKETNFQKRMFKYSNYCSRSCQTAFNHRHNEEFASKASEATRNRNIKNWEDPDYRERMISTLHEGRDRFYASEVGQALARKIVRENATKHDEKRKRAHSESLEKYWNNFVNRKIRSIQSLMRSKNPDNLYGSNRFQYRDTEIFMRSSGEILFAENCDKYKIKWKYEPDTFLVLNQYYTPDFYLPDFDMYIEVKGSVPFFVKKDMHKYKEFGEKFSSKLVILPITSFDSFFRGLGFE